MPVITVIRGSSTWPRGDSLGAGLALFQAHAAPASCPPLKLCTDTRLWARCAIARPNPRQKVAWRNEISKPSSAAGLTEGKSKEVL